MHFRLTPIETPRAFAVDQVSATGKVTRIKVFTPEQRKDAVKLVYRLNTGRRR
jgi:hypothetical protein